MKTCTPIHKFNKLGYSDKLDRSLPLPLAAAKVPDHRSDRKASLVTYEYEDVEFTDELTVL